MKSPVNAFWDYFRQHAQELSRQSSAENYVYDAMLAQLQQIHPQLFLEFCVSTPLNELVLTADGNCDLFPLIEEIASLAPSIPGWKVIALKPKLGFPRTVRWEGVVVYPAEVVFIPVFKNGTGELGLRLYVKGVTRENKEDVHNALLRALDSGLGERCFAEKISATWVYPHSELPSSAEPVPLLGLENYLSTL